MTALRPGQTYIGRWRVPILIDGRPTAISGTLWYAGDPSIVWFWPILVVIACVVAALRLRRPALNGRVARLLVLVALAAVATGAIGRELHGRPGVSILQLILLGLVLAFVAFGLSRVLLGTPGTLLLTLISLIALWAGVELITTLLNGYVLLAVPAFVARSASVLCIASGASLFVLVFATIDWSDDTA